MRFDTVLPSAILKPYVKQLVIAENEAESVYPVYPSTGLVMGFQYRGKLNCVEGTKEKALSGSGITGISDSFKVFRNSANIGTILVYFTEMGWANFTSAPANELFNYSIDLQFLFDKDIVTRLEDELQQEHSDRERIALVEQFLLFHLNPFKADELVREALRLIYASNGTIRIRDLNEKLCISQSPLEKRFRKLVGTSPKKFASLVRFNTVLNYLRLGSSLTTLSYQNAFFDQSHFIRDFRRYTGQAPESFKRSL